MPCERTSFLGVGFGQTGSILGAFRGFQVSGQNCKFGELRIEDLVSGGIVDDRWGYINLKK
jgi:predicted ester cyclase